MPRWEDGMEPIKIERLRLCEVLKDDFVDVPRMIKVNGVVRNHSRRRLWREWLRKVQQESPARRV